MTRHRHFQLSSTTTSQWWRDALGGGDDPNEGDDDHKIDDSNESSLDLDTFDEGKQEVPEGAGIGKFYKDQTPNGKVVVRIFKKSCDLADRDARAFWPIKLSDVMRRGEQPLLHELCSMKNIRTI